MIFLLRLCDLNTDEKGEIIRILSKGPIRRRLRDMGLIEGTGVKCQLISPCGNPKAYRIRGSLIAIRNEDAKDIYIKKKL